MSWLLDSVLDSVRRSQCEAHDAADREEDMAHHRRHGINLRHLALERPSMYRQPEPARYTMDIEVAGCSLQHIEGIYLGDLDAKLAFTPLIRTAPVGATCTLERNGELLEVVGRVA